jgi:isocitrate dehydrogenase kinase/phosphatase
VEKHERFARTILNGFESYFAEYQNITLAARPRYESADWLGMQKAARQRIDLYRKKVNKVIKFVKLIAGDQLKDQSFWVSARDTYAELLAGRNNFEIAETFFNSIYCVVFKHRKIRNEYAFVFSPHGDMPPCDETGIYRSYKAHGDLEGAMKRLLDDYAFSIPWENQQRDIDNVIKVVRTHLMPKFDLTGDNVEVQTLESHFYRNKGAYIVGRIVNNGNTMPFALPLLQSDKREVYVDTVLFGADYISVLFSFTRSYFLVDAAIPSQYVLFLQKLMPAKPISEIYSAMGYYKHGKTYYHRCAYRHMQSTTDKFIVAPGIKGMVMTVFTMPSYDFVFKIIKDKFTPPKEMTHEQVRAKYSMVKRADRAGRMADTQEFNNLAFARDRFSDELMEELHAVAPSVIEEHGKALVIKHVYVERRMTPLNLYLKDATDAQIYQVMDEYGNAIKQLASANIFPGDMLLKNFGVTRHGRVVFYDYDEICPLLDCNFRKIPEPRTEEEEMSGTPWYSVGPNDIFPEEFPLFFSGNHGARKIFDQLHSDIYEVSFWKDLQDRIRSGHVEDFFPYRRKMRFDRGGAEQEPVKEIA